jgi:Nitrogenase molybdenum-iron protein, alpha and beta chains
VATTPFRNIPIRERRTGAIEAYYGPAASALESVRKGEFAQRIRTFSQAKEDEIFTALRLLRRIPGTVTIVHGARGCSSALHFLSFSGGPGSPVVSTDLTEGNSIMGAEDTVRSAIVRSFERHNPQAIFVLTTPIVAINNDDVQSVAQELSEELTIPIIPVYTDGFKSKLGANGFDIAFHALAHFLIPQVNDGERNEEQINILTSLERNEDIAYLDDLAAALRLTANTFPGPAGIGGFLKSPASAATFGVRPETKVLGEFLEKNARVPYFGFLPPIGIQGTSTLIRNVAAKTGREKEGDLLVQVKSSSAEAFFAMRPLRDKKIYISGDIGTASGIAALVEEAGGEKPRDFRCRPSTAIRPPSSKKATKNIHGIFRCT